MHQEFTDNIAIIDWYLGNLEIPLGAARADLFSIEGTPTAWFDGAQMVLGAIPPSAYSLYLPVYQQRIAIQSDYTITMDLNPVSDDDYSLSVTVESLNGTIEETPVLYSILVESKIPFAACGQDTLNFVARESYPGIEGYQLNFSQESTQTFITDIGLEEDYVAENCEVVVFIENMETKEIYQGTSQALLQSTTGTKNIAFQDVNIYPNPANDFVNINSETPILSVKLCNLTGQMIRQKSFNENSVKFDTSGVDDGLYILQVSTGKNTINKRIVINSY